MTIPDHVERVDSSVPGKKSGKTIPVCGGDSGSLLDERPAGKETPALRKDFGADKRGLLMVVGEIRKLAGALVAGSVILGTLLFNSSHHSRSYEPSRRGYAGELQRTGPREFRREGKRETLPAEINKNPVGKRHPQKTSGRGRRGISGQDCCNPSRSGRTNSDAKPDSLTERPKWNRVFRHGDDSGRSLHDGKRRQ